MKKNILKGDLTVYDIDGAEHAEDCETVSLGTIEVEFFDNYYRLKLRFLDGSFRELWISQKTRLPKLVKAR